METIRGNELEKWKLNAEENYIKTPISVLKYITVLEEENERLHKHGVMQAEGSDGAKEAAVGQRSGGTVAEAWVATPKPKVPLEIRLDNLSKKIRARKSSEGQP